MSPTVREPALFVFVSMPKLLPRPAIDDRRRLVMLAVDEFARRYRLEPPAGSTWPHRRATDIDLDSLQQSLAGYSRVLNLLREEPGPPSGRASHQCLIYGHGDTLIVQLVLGLFDPWAGTLADGFRALMTVLHAGVDGSALEAAKHDLLGISAVYWALADDRDDLAAFHGEAGATLGEGGALCTQTDLGPLWRDEGRTFQQAQEVFQDRWLSVTHRRAERAVNQRYNQPRIDAPPDFVRVALARHKFAFERREYLREHERLEHRRFRLDRESLWIVQRQQRQHEELSELRSYQSLEFQRHLTNAGHELAEYQQRINQLRELHRTIRISLSNFLVFCPALVSAEGAARVAFAMHREEEAERVLASCAREEIFRSELGQMQRFSDQLEAGVDYAAQLAARYEAAVRSGLHQLRIAGEQALGEISGLHGLEAAAVVSSLAAVVTIELLKATLETHPLLGFTVLLLVVAGSFFFVRLLSSSGQVKNLWDRGSFATALAVLLVLATWGIHRAPLPWGPTSGGFWTFIRAHRVYLAILLVGLVGGLATYYTVELWTLGQRSARRQRRDRVLRVVGERLGTADALVDLVTDIPLTPRVFPLDEPKASAPPRSIADGWGDSAEASPLRDARPDVSPCVLLYVAPLRRIPELEETFGDLPGASPPVRTRFGARTIEIKLQHRGSTAVAARVHLRTPAVDWLARWSDPPEIP